MKKILVPVDGSEYSFKAIDKAKELSTAFGSEIVLIGVVDLYNSFVTLKPPEDFLKYLKQEKNNTLKILEEAKEKFAGSTNKVETVVLEGHPATAIVEYVNSNDCDLVIMGSHGMNKTRRFFIGSVTHKVVLEINKPILIVR